MEGLYKKEHLIQYKEYLHDCLSEIEKALKYTREKRLEHLTTENKNILISEIENVISELKEKLKSDKMQEIDEASQKMNTLIQYVEYIIQNGHLTNFELDKLKNRIRLL